MNSQPDVSCMCLTYGRPKVLEEAIYLFLLARLLMREELIVLNDYAEQILTFGHFWSPGGNVSKRFRTGKDERCCGP